MLIGNYELKLDDKKRITIPSKWRTVLGKNIVITNGLDNSLYLYSEKEWKVIAEKLSSVSLGLSEGRSFNRFILANAFPASFDKNGRIVLPDKLKSFASIDDMCVIVGMYNRAEIWSKKNYEEFEKTSIENLNQKAEKLAELNII